MPAHFYYSFSEYFCVYSQKTSYSLPEFAESGPRTLCLTLYNF